MIIFTGLWRQRVKDRSKILSGGARWFSRCFNVFWTRVHEISCLFSNKIYSVSLNLAALDLPPSGIRATKFMDGQSNTLLAKKQRRDNMEKCADCFWTWNRLGLPRGCKYFYNWEIFTTFIPGPANISSATRRRKNLRRLHVQNEGHKVGRFPVHYFVREKMHEKKEK